MADGRDKNQLRPIEVRMYSRTNLVGPLSNDLNLSSQYIGVPSYRHILNLALRDTNADVTLVAAMKVLHDNVSVLRPTRSISRTAKIMLKQVGVIRRGASTMCGINQNLNRMLKSVPEVNWRRFFGPDYRKVEKQIVCIAGYHDTDVTSWVNAMDVFQRLVAQCLTQE